MMYPYMTLEDGTEVTHSQLIENGSSCKVLVHFERPTKSGFDSMRCELPSYTWSTWEGSFSEEDLRFFERYLRNNAHLTCAGFPTYACLGARFAPSA